jgi:hypothetical protein
MKRKPTSSGSPSTSDTKVDPELVRQLESAPPEKPVQAVFTLKTPAGQPFRDAQDTREAVSRIIEGASSSAKQQPERVNVLANAQSFTISAPPAFVRAVLGDKEIAAALANAQREDMMIRPVDLESRTPPAAKPGASAKPRATKAAAKTAKTVKRTTTKRTTTKAAKSTQPKKAAKAATTTKSTKRTTKTSAKKSTKKKR